MGSSKSKAAVDAGLDHFAKGMSQEEAEAMWSQYDKNKDDELNRSEAILMLTDVIKKTQAGLKAQQQKLIDHAKKLKDEDIDSLLFKCGGLGDDMDNVRKFNFLRNAPEALGLSKGECIELWDKSDHNRDNKLSRAEARSMLRLIDFKEDQNKKEQIAKLEAALQDPATVDKMLDAFDITRDGKVSKDEFIKNAMEGYDVMSDERQAKRRRMEFKGSSTKDELLEKMRSYSEDNVSLPIDKCREVVIEFMTKCGEKAEDEEVDEMIRKAEKDTDGCVFFDDVVDLMMGTGKLPLRLAS